MLKDNPFSLQNAAFESPLFCHFLTIESILFLLALITDLLTENHEGNIYLWVWPVKLTLTLRLAKVEVCGIRLRQIDNQKSMSCMAPGIIRGAVEHANVPVRDWNTMLKTSGDIFP